jgi:teichuronic acid biosynthesis glycosyltransferase TuaH
MLDTTGSPVLYDITDDWLAAQRPPAEIARLAAAEDRLLAGAAAVVVCSAGLARTKGARRRDVVVVTNGVDAAAYLRQLERPPDLPAGRVVLYAGTLHADRLDLALCERTAAALGDGGTLVLLGPDALESTDRARLVAAGVALLGPRPFDAVPAYLRHADVLVVPHVVDAFTDSLDPIKLYEYRAAGRPVVSTPVAGFRDAADPRVRAVAAEEFPAAVRAALAAAEPAPGPVPDALPADLPTWDRQAARMADVLAAVTAPPAGSRRAAAGPAPAR